MAGRNEGRAGGLVQPRPVPGLQEGHSPRRGRPPVPAALGGRARALRAAGWSWSRIAAELGLGRTTVRELCAKSEDLEPGADEPSHPAAAEGPCVKSRDGGPLEIAQGENGGRLTGG